MSLGVPVAALPPTLLDTGSPAGRGTPLPALLGSSVSPALLDSLSPALPAALLPALPGAFLPALVGAVAGALAGAVVPGLAHRMATPVDGPPRSACRACGQPPPSGAAGWVATRCTHCEIRRGPPVVVTVVIGAIVLGGLAAARHHDPALPALLGMAVVGLVLGAVDLACLRLPDPLVATAGLVGAVGLTAAALLTGTPGRLLTVLAGAAGSALLYVVLALLPGSRLGFGDVKLGAVLGLPLGWLGWPSVLLGLALPHLLNGLVVLVLLALRRVRRDTVLPLGPALLAGAWLAALLA
ncbi:A24 family peptidase [Micromonospora fluostatini]|uniref:prepilin peptidase n=1 Tax=Micromonospora sp. JCM 30529 TaxID=3421643 RepID=UPI003D16ABC7